MAKFTAEEKIQAVKRYLAGREGHKTIAREIGVSSGVFQVWIRKYHYHGESAFQKLYTTYSVEDKLKVLHYMIENGTSIRETAAIFNIQAPSTVAQWQKLFETGGIDALKPMKKGRPSMTKKNQKRTKKQTPQEGSVEAMQAEIERLRMENAYLKKLNNLSSKQGKITKFELRTEFPVKALLKLAGIPRSTYYYWVKTFGLPDKDAKLKTLIQSIYHEHKGRYGYRRIRDELKNRGYQMNHKKIYRLMKELGLKCLVRMKKYRSYKGETGTVAPNRLERNFKAEKPKMKWVTDITEFKLFGEKLYLSPMLDLFNGEIIAYTIGSRPTYSLVSEMLEKSFEQLTDKENLLIHSDQGWHYQMKQYRHALKERNIIQSMSRKGNCYDNAVIESFFGILKSEFIHFNEFQSIEHFKQELVTYIDYYNHKRIKAKLKGMSPVQYRIHASHVT
ncbi:IS3 family transposase [Bacillus sp. FSL M8-0052]|uniref:IS3 family transposase n=1 Tax=Bacillus glycinifermentans TaxID=1664069 RepID=A0AAJ3Z2S1_9BACI|nr:IS3 family transposase [Bacillus glycinifermentans]QAT66785.1 IS3 family transposase [Bacillus glycinifermentans]WKB76539.1 IS3 family transposase [Bacillus glycinifermentans]